jgi:hypothetical protein
MPTVGSEVRRMSAQTTDIVAAGTHGRSGLLETRLSCATYGRPEKRNDQRSSHRTY